MDNKVNIKKLLILIGAIIGLSSIIGVASYYYTVKQVERPKITQNSQTSANNNTPSNNTAGNNVNTNNPQPENPQPDNTQPRVAAPANTPNPTLTNDIDTIKEKNKTIIDYRHSKDLIDLYKQSGIYSTGKSDPFTENVVTDGEYVNSIFYPKDNKDDPFSKSGSSSGSTANGTNNTNNTNTSNGNTTGISNGSMNGGTSNGTTNGSNSNSSVNITSTPPPNTTVTVNGNN